MAQARGFERDEFGARVDDATRKGDRARLPLGWDRDDEARKAERRPPRTEDSRARDWGARAGNQYRHRRAGPDRRGSIDTAPRGPAQPHVSASAARRPRRISARLPGPWRTAESRRPRLSCLARHRVWLPAPLSVVRVVWSI